MLSKEYTVLAAEGLHARPAKALLNLVKSFKCKVTLKKGDTEADARSMLGILSMEAVYNSRITIIADGEDEQETFERLDKFFNEEIVNL